MNTSTIVDPRKLAIQAVYDTVLDGDLAAAEALTKLYARVGCLLASDVELLSVQIDLSAARSCL